MCRSVPPLDAAITFGGGRSAGPAPGTWSGGAPYFEWAQPDSAITQNPGGSVSVLAERDCAPRHRLLGEEHERLQPLFLVGDAHRSSQVEHRLPPHTVVAGEEGRRRVARAEILLER